MRNLLLVGLLLVSVSACLQDFGENLGGCLGTVLGEAMGNAFLLSQLEDGKSPTRPDEAALGDGGARVSVAHAGGRLGFVFSGAPRTEALPRLDAGCTVEDWGYFLPPGWPDAGTGGGLKGQVTLVEATPVDGGTHLVLDATGLTLTFSDGGTAPVPDAHLDVVAR